MIDSSFGLHDASGREQSSLAAVSAGQSAVPTDLDLCVSVAGTGSHGARRPARRATGSGGHLQQLENQDSPGRPSSQEDSSGVADRTGVLAGATTRSGAAGEERQSVGAATDAARQRVVPAATAARPAPDRHRGRSENRVGPNRQLVPRQLRFGRRWRRICYLRSVTQA